MVSIGYNNNKQNGGEGFNILYLIHVLWQIVQLKGLKLLKNIIFYLSCFIFYVLIKVI